MPNCGPCAAKGVTNCEPCDLGLRDETINKRCQACIRTEVVCKSNDEESRNIRDLDKQIIKCMDRCSALQKDREHLHNDIELQSKPEDLQMKTKFLENLPPMRGPFFLETREFGRAGAAVCGGARAISFKYISLKHGFPGEGATALKALNNYDIRACHDEEKRC